MATKTPPSTPPRSSSPVLKAPDAPLRPTRTVAVAGGGVSLSLRLATAYLADQLASPLADWVQMVRNATGLDQQYDMTVNALHAMNLELPNHCVNVSDRTTAAYKQSVVTWFISTHQDSLSY